MKICIPVTENLGPDSPVSEHFGSAPLFAIADTQGPDIVFVSNNNDDDSHGHGMCQPLAILGGQTFDAVVVGGIGAGALGKFNAAGVCVYRSPRGTIADVLEASRSGTLQEISMRGACGGHHGCSH